MKIFLPCLCLVVLLERPIAAFQTSIIALPSKGGRSPAQQPASSWKRLSVQLHKNEKLELKAMQSNDDAGASKSLKLDTSALLKYGAAIAIQMTCFTALFRGLDKLKVIAGIPNVPFAVNCVLFYALALKSRIFNPLLNSRPSVDTLESTSTGVKRNMPSWTPPGVVFPIVWLLIIGPIRAVASSLIVQTTGTYANPTLLALMLHLSIGDVWNTINNVEKRYGVAVMGVLLVWLSKANAAYQFYQVHAMAGKLLGATLVWLTIAAALVTATWRLNTDPMTKKVATLYPSVGEATTKFAWFASSKK
jgi:benzodiazapine receptor